MPVQCQGEYHASRVQSVTTMLVRLPSKTLHHRGHAGTADQCQEQTSHTDNVGRLRETTLRRSPLRYASPIGVRTLTPHQRPCG
jgi:hypothetical protein